MEEEEEKKEEEEETPSREEGRKENNDIKRVCVYIVRKETTDTRGRKEKARRRCEQETG